MLARRFYGDRRVNGAFLRKGFKDWVDQGFPRDPNTGAAPQGFMRRGWDSWVKVSHLVVYREPADSTFYNPCAIVAAPHPAIRPKTLKDWGIGRDDRSHMARQMRNSVYTVEQLLRTWHPLSKQGFRHVFHTPKYRHGTHTMPIDTDFMAALFGPFGDMYRRDKRTPGDGEMYVDIHPLDAKRLGINDGDYVWIDGDPNDLPFRGWNEPSRQDAYKVARLMARARYYPGTLASITRMWFNGYMATPGTVKAAESRPDGLAKNPETHYQALFRPTAESEAVKQYLEGEFVRITKA